MAEALLDRDTLNRAEFEMVMRGEELPPKTEAEQVELTPAAIEAEEAEENEQPEEPEGEAFIEPGEENK